MLRQGDRGCGPGDGQHAPRHELPAFAESKSNKTLANFIKYVGKDKANGFAVWGWVSTLLFQQAANQVIKDTGVNGLTRPTSSTALKNTHSFDAGGMWGTMDPGNQAAPVLHDPQVRRQQVRP